MILLIVVMTCIRAEGESCMTTKKRVLDTVDHDMNPGHAVLFDLAERALFPLGVAGEGQRRHCRPIRLRSPSRSQHKFRGGG